MNNSVLLHPKLPNFYYKSVNFLLADYFVTPKIYIIFCKTRVRTQNAILVISYNSQWWFLSDIYRKSDILNPEKPIIPTGFRYCVKLHFRHFRFRFLSGWSCFNGLVRNLNLECAWRKSYHSIKRIINPAFLSQCGHGWPRRFVEWLKRLKPGQFVKEFNVQDM